MVGRTNGEQRWQAIVLDCARCLGILHGENPQMQRNDFHRILQGIGCFVKMTLKGVNQLDDCLQKQRIVLFLWLMRVDTTTSSRLVTTLIRSVCKTGSTHLVSRHTILLIQFRHIQQIAGSNVRFMSLTTSTITSPILDALSFLQVTAVKTEGLKSRKRVVNHPHRIKLKARWIGGIKKRNNMRYDVLTHDHPTWSSIFLFAVILMPAHIPNVQNWRMSSRAWKDVFVIMYCKSRC